MKQTHTGGCQCGQVRYEVALDLDAPVIACNCSRCGRLGSLLSFAPAADFKLSSGEDAVTEYKFNKHAIHICSARPAASSRSRAARTRRTARKWSRSMRARSTASSRTR